MYYVAINLGSSPGLWAATAQTGQIIELKVTGHPVYVPIVHKFRVFFHPTYIYPSVRTSCMETPLVRILRTLYRVSLRLPFCI